MDAGQSDGMAFPPRKRTKTFVETLPHRGTKDILALGEVVHVAQENRFTRIEQGIAQNESSLLRLDLVYMPHLSARPDFAFPV